jgi:RNA polymerase sigma-70 factor (ECF subfamily)
MLAVFGRTALHQNRPWEASPTLLGTIELFGKWRTLTHRAERAIAGQKAGMSDAAARIHERVLVLRIQSGDEYAFTELVERYHARLYAYLRTLFGSTDQVDDALQEVWFDVYRSVPKLADPGAFSAWVYRIAHNRAMRELRERRPLHVPLNEEEFAEEEDDNDSISGIDAGQIHGALNRLAPEHREVLVLRFMNDMSYEEIASVVDCPVGTVRSRIHYAKRALRQALMQNG